MRFDSSRGFSLVEALVALSIVSVGLASLAQLVGMAVRAELSARATTMATALAQQKLEQLRALNFSFDSAGIFVTDVDLGSSPANTLDRNVAGYFDFVDSHGTSLGESAAPSAGAAYVRRWSVVPLPVNPRDALVLQVLVSRWNTAAGHSGSGQPPDAARLVTVRRRGVS